jgi:hypothetical protein
MLKPSKRIRVCESWGGPTAAERFPLSIERWIHFRRLPQTLMIPQVLWHSENESSTFDELTEQDNTT